MELYTRQDYHMPAAWSGYSITVLPYSFISAVKSLRGCREWLVQIKLRIVTWETQELSLQKNAREREKKKTVSLQSVVIPF